MSQYIIFAVGRRFFVYTMRAVDLTLAEKLREVLDLKIRKCRYLHAYRCWKNTGPNNGLSMGSSTDTGYSYREWKQRYENKDMMIWVMIDEPAAQGCHRRECYTS